MAYTNSSNFAKKFCAKSPFKQNGIKDKMVPTKDVTEEKLNNPEYLVKSKTKTIDSEGNVTKTKVNKGGYNVKEKTISGDGMTYTKSKTKGGKTKTKEGKTLKGHISGLFQNKAGGEQSQPFNEGPSLKEMEKDHNKNARITEGSRTRQFIRRRS